MKSLLGVPFTQWAAIHQSEKFVSLQPLSGFRRQLPEDDDRVIYLQPDPTDEILGRALLETLDKSRFLDPRKHREFSKPDRIRQANARWHQDFMARYGYRTKHQAYATMRYCRARRREGEITLTPHRRDHKPELWWDLPEDRRVIIPATKDPVVAGAALKLALSRCE